MVSEQCQADDADDTTKQHGSAQISTNLADVEDFIKFLPIRILVS